MAINPRNIRIEDYSYDLPEERIAKYPVSERKLSDLLVYDTGRIADAKFYQLPDFLDSDTLLVFNNTKVIRARLIFYKSTGAKIEIFCLEPANDANYTQELSRYGYSEWRCIIGNAKKWKAQYLERHFAVANKTYVLKAEKVKQPDQSVVVRFYWNSDFTFSQVLYYIGKMPVPPYLNRESETIDEYRYQTVYSSVEGSVAAPTAGLHFTEDVLNAINAKGIKTEELTLHVGAGTFQPVKDEYVGKHEMHAEVFYVSRDALCTLKNHAGKLLPVGTTSLRTLESLYWLGVKARNQSGNVHYLEQWEPYTREANISAKEAMQSLITYLDTIQKDYIEAETKIIIAPGYRFFMADQLITNFHQPKSTLLLLVAAFLGEDWKKVYNHALSHEYRFLSYGDSSLLKI